MSARAIDRGLVYLRRSGKRQETSLSTQLDWAIEEAKRLKIRLDASASDLEFMRTKRLHSHKGIRLDDGVSGSDLDRPGFMALNRDALSYRGISHVLIFRRDRFSRPEVTTDAMEKERELSSAGITLVLSTKIIEPAQRGRRDLARDIEAMLEYSSGGEFLEKLAETMIVTHKALAKQGFSTGGTPPYGHVRGLFGPDGKLVEVLPKGKTVRQEGFHVRWIPGDDDENRAKIRTWMYILARCESGDGAKRIANQLNQSGIPSPGAGTIRTDGGSRHKVTGKWSQTSVLNIARNSAISAIKTYGTRSEGKFRRLSEDKWRFLDDSDRRPDDKPKVIRNPEQLIITAGTGASPIVAPERLSKIQAMLEKRGRCQRGIPRAKDPTKYPLSGRVIDLSDGCGSPMYGTTQSGRPVMRCGRYMRTASAECNNNQVDGEALLRHVLGSILSSIGGLFARDELKSELLKIANSEDSNRISGKLHEAQLAESKLKSLRADLELIQKNLARAKDQESYDSIDHERLTVKKEIDDLELMMRNADSVEVDVSFDPHEEVERALCKLNDIQLIASNADARLEIRTMLSELGCRVGLSFVDAIKGKKRTVRKLAGGIIVFGDQDLPVKLHGKDRVGPCDGNPDITERDNQNHNAEGPGSSGPSAKDNSIDGNGLPSSPDVFPTKCYQEDISITKVNRADRI